MVPIFVDIPRTTMRHVYKKNKLSWRPTVVKAGDNATTMEHTYGGRLLFFALVSLVLLNSCNTPHLHVILLPGTIANKFIKSKCLSRFPCARSTVCHVLL